VPKYACGHPKGFSMGFGHNDPLAKCRACNERDDRRKAIGCALVLLGIVAVATAFALLTR